MSKVVQVDMELKKAFQELQAKMVETAQKIKIANVQIDELKRQKTRAELTESEIVTLDPSTKLYQSVGQMFLSTDMPSVLKLLKSRSQTADEKIKNLESSKEYLEKSLKDSENNLREMVQQRKERDEL
ncbi:UNVERIFIED_CONTAM: hypothetical protein PYX00_002109 [Menopon gallinae]|uniref:Prefoldin subunit 1 n=1 Tax=Menopon gallinae TaxID=328185 RepID=A0AAW2IH58_9NEOP